LFFFPLSKPLLPICDSFHFHSKQNKTKTNWKKWRGAADLYRDRYSPPREQYQLVHVFNILLRLPFVLIFFTLAVLLSLFLGNKFFSIISFLSSVRFIAILQFQFSFMNFYFWRTLGILGCTQSLMPLHNADAAARLTSHISVELRACCELSQGNFYFIDLICYYCNGFLLLLRCVWINNLIKCL
jgi:hypothetical protein